MSGGKSMKNNVIGSRRTVMNSLKRIAFSPRNGARFMALRQPSSVAASLCEAWAALSRRTGRRPHGDGYRRDFPSRGFLLVIFAGMFRRQGNENVFERRTDFVDLRTVDPDAAKLFVDLLATNALVHEKVHRLPEDGCIQHALHFAHRAQRNRDVIAGDVEPTRSGWADFRHSLQVVGLAANNQL